LHQTLNSIRNTMRGQRHAGPSLNLPRELHAKHRHACYVFQNAHPRQPRIFWLRDRKHVRNKTHTLPQGLVF
jgi:hypothetical protein